MKLVFGIYKYFPYSGLALDMIRIANECVGRGHNVTILTLSWQGQKPDNINVIEISTKGFTNHTKAAAFHRDFSKEILQNDFDFSIGFNKIPGVDYYFCGDHCFAAHSENHKNLLYRFSPRYFYFSRYGWTWCFYG